MADGENINRRARRKEKKPPKKITEKYLYNAGLAYLQRFTSSIPNFRRVMMRKIDKSCNFHKEQERETCIAHLDATIATFERQGLLNDDAYTQGMVNSLRRRGLSSRAIQAKLQQKGLAADAIMAALAVFDGDDNKAEAELIAAVQMTKRKRLGAFGKEAPEDDSNFHNKQLASLARSGFAFDVAQKALALNIDEAEEILAQRSY